MKPRKCLILNPYTRSLKEASIPQNLENWYAVMGCEDVQQFPLEKIKCSVLYPNDIWNKLTGTIAGTKFKSWEHPVFGILLFVGPPDNEGATTDLKPEAIHQILEAFKTAKIQRFRFRD